MFLLKCQFGAKAFYEEVERSVRGPENVSMQIFGLTMTVIFFIIITTECCYMQYNFQGQI